MPRFQPIIVVASLVASETLLGSVLAFRPGGRPELQPPRGASVAGAAARRSIPRPSSVVASSSPRNEDAGEGGGTVVTEYRNAVTEVLSNFMQKTPDMDMEKKGGDPGEEEAGEPPSSPLASVDFDAPKFRKVDLSTLAEILDYELSEREWFVTGDVNPAYFSDDFRFQDPDVKVDGIEDYARGVRKLFDQRTSRAEIISTIVNANVPDTITCTWRLSGAVNIGPGLTIKPYVCYTDFTVDEESGLITFQEDRFDVPGWDILLSSVFPFLVGNLLAGPAPPVAPREVPMPAALRTAGEGSSSVGEEGGSPMGRLLSSFFGN